MRTIRNICSLFGHRRDKSRVRLIGDAWHSNCARCGVGLKRMVSGKTWTPSMEGEMRLAVHPKPRSTVDPFVRPSAAKAVNDQKRQPEQQMKFAGSLVTAIAPQLRPRHERGDYYIIRAEEARHLADRAEEQQIKMIHLEMAARYYSLANYYLERRPPVSAVG